MIRGFSLNSPVDGEWPWREWEKGGRDEVAGYLDALQVMNVNAIRHLLRLSAFDANPRYAGYFVEFTDMLQRRNMRLLLWVDFEMPSHKGLGDRKADPRVYDAILRANKDRTDRVLGHYFSKRPISPVIMGLTLGNGEDPWNLANTQMLRDLVPHLRAMAPHCNIGIEAYSTDAGMLEEPKGTWQFVSLAPSRPAPRILERSLDPLLDYLSLAHYNWTDKGIDTLLDTIESQNPGSKPFFFDEYATYSHLGPAVSYFLIQVQEDHASGYPRWIGGFVWDALASWNPQVLDPAKHGFQEFSPFEYDESRPDRRGEMKPWARMYAERNSVVPLVWCGFDDRFSEDLAVDDSGRANSLLLTGAARTKGISGLAARFCRGKSIGRLPYCSELNCPHLYFETWVNAARSSSERTIVARDGSYWIGLTPDSRIIVRAALVPGSRPDVEANRVLAPQVESCSRVPSGKWTKLAVSFDGCVWRLFVNGVLDAEKAASGAAEPCGLASSTHGLTFGACEEGRRGFDGMLDNLVIAPEPPALARWMCDEDSGGRLPNCLGKHFPGELFGKVSYAAGVCEHTDGQGRPSAGNSLSLDGTGGARIVGSEALFLPHFTVDFYFRATDLEPRQWLIGRGTITQDAGWAVMLADGQLSLGLAGGVRASIAVRARTWHHVRASWDGRRARLSVDGNLVDSVAESTESPRWSLRPITIGAYSASPTVAGFSGQIDHIELYTTAR